MSKDIANILLPMIGIIIGVLISIYPNQIEEQRDYHNKISNHWGLINHELTSIIDVCNKLTNAINSVMETSNSTMMRNLPDTAWKTSINDGDFLQALDKDTFAKLEKLYHGVDLLNNTSSAYLNFTTTSGALTTYHQIIKTYHTNILGNLSQAIKDSNAVLEQVKEKESNAKKKAECYEKRLEILWKTGFILLVGVMLFCLWFLVGDYILKFLSAFSKNC